MDSLARSGLVLFVLLAAHTVDHAINQPAREVPAISGLVGLIGFAIVAAAIVLALLGNPYAPEGAIIAGAGTVAGFIVIHLLGDWTPLSDPYWDFDANPLSWALLIAPMIAALALTAEGVRRLPGRALPA
jgi:hypothetical protein